MHAACVTLTGGQAQVRTRPIDWPSVPEGRLSRPWWSASLGAATGAVLFALTRRGLTDDAMITLSYARTLAETGTWGVESGFVANTQTSPANAIALGAITAVTHRPGLAVGVLLVAALALTGWWTVRIADELAISRWTAPTLLVLLTTSPLLISTVGLEAYLGVAVLIGTVRYSLARRDIAVGVLVGLAVLVRPDLAVPAAALAVGLARPVRRRLATMVGVAVGVALPWHVLAWVALGGFLPDTTWVKTAHVDGPSILGGPVDFMALYYPGATPVAALPVVAALSCAIGWVVHNRASDTARTVVVLVAAGWAHLLALAAIGAVGMSWYYAPIVATGCAAVALTLGAAGARVAVAVSAVLVGLGAAGIVAWGPLPWTWLPMVANVAESGQYAQIGRELGLLTGGEPVEGPGEVGALAFHSDVAVLDFLSDPARTDALLARERALAGPMRRTVMDLSAAWRRPTPMAPLRWALVFADQPAPTAGRVVHSWPVSTPVRGPDRVLLVDRATAR